MNSNVTKEEWDLYYFIDGRAGSFKSNLIRTIMSADTENKNILFEAYPALTIVVVNYQNTIGYWEDLVKRIEG